MRAGQVKREVLDKPHFQVLQLNERLQRVFLYVAQVVKSKDIELFL